MSEPQDDPGDGVRSRTPLLLALALAAVVAGVATVASLGHGPIASRRLESPTPEVLAVHPPPADRSLVWFAVNGQQSPGVLQLRATDWRGREQGNLAISCIASCGAKPSPDGQRLLIGGLPGSASSQRVQGIFDAGGRRVATLDGVGARWADDSRHLCVLGSVANAGTAEAEISLIDASTGARRSAATVTAPPGLGPNGVWKLLSCSVAGNRAVLTFNDQRVRAVRAVRLSDGATVYGRDDVGLSGQCGCPVATVAVSDDSSIAVEDLAEGGVRRLDLSAAPELADLPSLAGRGPVTALSWNGRLALTPIGVFDTATGRTVWPSPSPSYLLMDASQPRGDGMLVSVWVGGAASSRQVIVGAGGAPVDLPSTWAPQPPPP